MIDEYYKVEVNRISPEFPMPIMSSLHDIPIAKPGGVANVANQFKNFNAEVTLHCFPSKNQSMKSWSGLVDYGIDVNSNIPIKKRFLHDGVQVVRHDIEEPLCGLSEQEIDEFTKHLCQMFNDQSDKPDVVIFSDYNKGFFSSSKHNIVECFSDSITIVDPKKGPIEKWRGCTIFKPNAKEAEELSGMKDWKLQSKFFQEKLGCKSVVITFGGKMVAGIHNEEYFCYVPDKHVKVESVVGAGDTFCAFLALAVGHGFEVPEAVEIAWGAGSVYVQNNLNRPIVPAELSPDGIVDPQDLVSRDFNLVFTNGCYDILHEGHLSTLRFAKKQGDKLVVGVNSDASVKRLKGEKRPIKNIQQRMALLAAFEMVDFVVPFEEDTPLEIIKIIKPDVLVKGGDYCKDTIVGSDIVPTVLVAPTISGVSTTALLSI